MTRAHNEMAKVIRGKGGARQWWGHKGKNSNSFLIKGLAANQPRSPTKLYVTPRQQSCFYKIAARDGLGARHYKQGSRKLGLFQKKAGGLHRGTKDCRDLAQKVGERSGIGGGKHRSTKRDGRDLRRGGPIKGTIRRRRIP